MKPQLEAGPQAPRMQALSVRDAVAADLEVLNDIEQRCFSSDRISRRSFRRFLASPRDILLVAERGDGQVLGYALVLRRRATRLARLYSLAVRAEARGLGVGETLVHAAEDAAQRLGCVDMRLEVGRDNHAAAALYQRMGYQVFAELPNYYESEEDALRMQKRIRLWHGRDDYPRVPYYPQSTEFTCGPASLLMAMGALEPAAEASLKDELDIWREATTIFMAAGHGGCGPHGLAIAARRRGFRAELYCNSEGPLFVDGVRQEPRKRLLAQIHEHFLSDCEAHGVAIHAGRLSVQEMAERLEQGWIPIVLISLYRLTRERAPHWVVVTAVDGDFVYVHDPDIDAKLARRIVDKQNIPLECGVFDGISRYGQANLRATVLIARGD